MTPVLSVKARLMILPGPLARNNAPIMVLSLMFLAVSLGRDASKVTSLMSPSVRSELDVMQLKWPNLSRLGVSVALRSGHFTAPNRLHCFR